MITERFDRALHYATLVHGGQKRKGTQTPYISHLFAVASLVLENGGTEDEAIGALLHDAAEDQGGNARLDDIRIRFGDHVADIVAECSDSLETDASQKAPWHERKSRYHRRLRENPDSSSYLVSAADKLHNARSMAQDERNEGETLWKRFNAEKRCALWNLNALVKIYGELHDPRVDRIVNELRRAVAELDGGEKSLCDGAEHQRKKLAFAPEPDAA